MLLANKLIKYHLNIRHNLGSNGILRVWYKIHQKYLQTTIYFHHIKIIWYTKNNLLKKTYDIAFREFTVLVCQLTRLDPWKSDIIVHFPLDLVQWPWLVAHFLTTKWVLIFLVCTFRPLQWLRPHNALNENPRFDICFLASKGFMSVSSSWPFLHSLVDVWFLRRSGL